MSFNFEIAIPSYNRPKIIGEKSLKLLMDFGVSSNDILIFVRDKEQQKLYEKEIGDCFRFHLTGQTGIDSTRNYLREYYHTHPEAEKLDGVLFMDDDITFFSDMGKPITEPFMDLIKYFFLETKKRNCRLWAVNALNNSFYMKDKISTTLRYCIGAFQGLIIDRTKPIIFCDVGHFEDFQFSCEHFLADGGVVRFDRYGITTKYFELQGGICGQLGGLKNRQKEMEENAHYMVARYGEMCRIKIKKWGYDLRLNNFYKHCEA
tara:strand:- start:3664 stop:4449 length:786 start_codon:yes stop_codon:yes gene_type:complete